MIACCQHAHRHEKELGFLVKQLKIPEAITDFLWKLTQPCLSETAQESQGGTGWASFVAQEMLGANLLGSRLSDYKHYVTRICSHLQNYRIVA